MSALVGLFPLTGSFGWVGLVGSLVLDLTFGVGLAVAIPVMSRVADGT